MKTYYKKNGKALWGKRKEFKLLNPEQLEWFDDCYYCYYNTDDNCFSYGYDFPDEDVGDVGDVSDFFLDDEEID